MLFKKLIPALLWAFFILILCGLPGKAIPNLSFLDWLKPDKIVHLFLFGPLCFLLIKAFLEQNTYRILASYSKVISVVISAGYGVLIEILQTYIFIGRNGDKYDAMANTIGALAGLWFFNYRTKRTAKRAC